MCAAESNQASLFPVSFEVTARRSGRTYPKANSRLSFAANRLMARQTVQSGIGTIIGTRNPKDKLKIVAIVRKCEDELEWSWEKSKTSFETSSLEREIEIFSAFRRKKGKCLVSAELPSCREIEKRTEHISEINSAVNALRLPLRRLLYPPECKKWSSIRFNF